jgi:hypothetical protein
MTKKYTYSYKVVQIWSGLFVCKQITVCPGHIWTTLYITVLQCWNTSARKYPAGRENDPHYKKRLKTADLVQDDIPGNCMSRQQYEKRSTYVLPAVRHAALYTVTSNRNCNCVCVCNMWWLEARELAREAFCSRVPPLVAMLQQYLHGHLSTWGTLNWKKTSSWKTTSSEYWSTRNRTAREGTWNVVHHIL